MSNDNDEALRHQLESVMAMLKGSAGRDPELRRTIGGFARHVVKTSGVKNWAEVKQRTTPANATQMLAYFRNEAERFRAVGNMRGVDATSVLVMSLLKPERAAMVPGARALDRYVESCMAAFKPAARVVPTTVAARRPAKLQ